MATDLITGASGFIGSHLRRTLLDRGSDVVAVRRPKSPPSDIGRSVELAYDDVDALTELMRTEKPRVVYHVAGAVKGVTYEDFARANVMPTANLLEAIKTSGHTPHRFVHVSSLASYGPSTEDKPLREGDEPAPIEHYGKSKLEAERVVETSGVPYTIVRPGGVYGPGDVDYYELFKLAARGWSIFYGNRHRWWSAIYVDDLVDAILTAVERDEAKDRDYFLSDGVPLTWESFQRTLSELVERKVREVDLPEALTGIAAWGGELLTSIDKKPRLFNRQKALMGKQSAWTCTNERAREDLGFTPRFDVNEGAKVTLEWYRAEGWV